MTRISEACTLFDLFNNIVHSLWLFHIITHLLILHQFRQSMTYFLVHIKLYLLLVTVGKMKKPSWN